MIEKEQIKLENQGRRVKVYRPTKKEVWDIQKENVCCRWWAMTPEERRVWGLPGYITDK